MRRGGPAGEESCLPQPLPLKSLGANSAKPGSATSATSRGEKRSGEGRGAAFTVRGEKGEWEALALGPGSSTKPGPCCCFCLWRSRLWTPETERQIPGEAGGGVGRQGGATRLDHRPPTQTTAPPLIPKFIIFSRPYRVFLPLRMRTHISRQRQPGAVVDATTTTTMAGAPHRGWRHVSSAATLLPLLLAAGARATATEWVAEGGALQGRHLPPSSLEGRGRAEARATAVHVPSAFDGPDSPGGTARRCRRPEAGEAAGRCGAGPARTAARGTLRTRDAAAAELGTRRTGRAATACGAGEKWGRCGPACGGTGEPPARGAWSGASRRPSSSTRGSRSRSPRRSRGRRRGRGTWATCRTGCCGWWRPRWTAPGRWRPSPPPASGSGRSLRTRCGRSCASGTSPRPGGRARRRPSRGRRW